MSWWIKVDDAVLGWGDSLVLWLWNELGVSWIYATRAFLIIWMFLQITSAKLAGVYMVPSYIMVCFVLGVRAFEEWLYRLRGLDAIAASQAMGRSTSFSRTLRLMLLLVSQTWYPPLTHDLKMWVGIAATVSCPLVLWLMATIPPTGPRDPKRIFQLAPARS